MPRKCFVCLRDKQELRENLIRKPELAKKLDKVKAQLADLS